MASKNQASDQKRHTDDHATSPKAGHASKGKNSSREGDKDNQGSPAVTGRFQVIPAHPEREFPKTTLAAGAVLWRGTRGDLSSIRVAIIHRPHYNDWSLAKGKLDSGETIPGTAVREIQEETGYHVSLDKLLGKVTYPVRGRTKVVYYFLAEVTGGKFVANDEVDVIEWLPIEQARSLVTYELDRQVLDKAAKRLSLEVDSRLLLIRHARAGERLDDEVADLLRGLDKKGKAQAEGLVDILNAYQPDRLISALPYRCRATAEPFARATGVAVEVDARCGDSHFLADRGDSFRFFEQLSTAPGTTAVVSQGAAIKGVLAYFAKSSQIPLPFTAAAGKAIPGGATKKGSVWVLSFNQGTLIGADYLQSPLPIER